MTTQTTTPRLMTVRAAAKWLSLGESTVYALVASGELPSISIGRAKRLDIQDLERWLESRKRAA
jgi:excisionase family DNA binding protein